MIFKTQFIFPGKMLIQGDPVDLLNVIHYFSYSISTARSQRLMKHYSSYRDIFTKYIEIQEMLQHVMEQAPNVLRYHYDSRCYRVSFPPTTVVTFANII